MKIHKAAFTGNTDVTLHDDTTGRMNMNQLWIKLRTVLICAAILSVAVLFGCSAGSSDGGTDPLSGAEHQQAKTLYKNNCIRCHASDLSGLVGAASDLRTVGDRLTAEQIADIIANGRDLMPAFADRLEAEEIQALADWLAEQR